MLFFVVAFLCLVVCPIQEKILTASMFFKCGLYNVPVLDYLLLSENIAKFTSICSFF